jgi:hypothetical protein
LCLIAGAGGDEVGLIGIGWRGRGYGVVWMVSVVRMSWGGRRKKWGVEDVRSEVWVQRAWVEGRGRKGRLKRHTTNHGTGARA